MTLKVRFSLIGIGIIIFLIITPIIVLYARGFIFDIKTWKITKTGALVVETEPEKATVFIDDKEIDNPTPSNIRFLAPADYNIRVEKDGYQPWTKRLNVREQLVTWANLNRDFITLFLKHPKLSKTWPETKASISELRDEIVFTANNEVKVINVNSGNVSNLGNLNNFKQISLPPKLNLSWQNTARILQALQNRTSIGLTEKQIAQISALKTNGNHFVAKIGLDLYSLDAIPGTLLDKNVLTFTFDGDSIWYISDDLLKRYNLLSQTIEIINRSVPNATSGEIIRANNQIYAILDNHLYVLNDAFEKIYDSVTRAGFNNSSNLLVFQNNNEVLTYNPGTKKIELILRSATEVNNPLINPETGYLFFQNEGKIKAIELDGRDHRNIYDITEAGTNFALDSAGKNLYIINNSEIKKIVIR